MSFSDLGITVRLDGKYRGLIYEDELDYQRQRLYVTPALTFFFCPRRSLSTQPNAD
jgi:hypothetical protein